MWYCKFVIYQYHIIHEIVYSYILDEESVVLG